MSKKKIICIASAAVLVAALAASAVCLVLKGKIANIVNDEAEWDLKDSAVKPLPVSIDVNNLEDGIYPVAFERDEIEKTEEGCRIEFEIFNMDLYDAVELHLLEVGQYIEVMGELIKIDSLTTDGTVVINGGIENGGAEFTSIGGGVYRYFGMDDMATYTSFGKTTLTVPSGVPIVDYWDITADAVVANEVYEYLKECELPFFNEFNTKIRIEDGRIVEFVRVYIP